ncbi:FadR/GntR family transcriptional regulator [Occultella kanbiaonis]|uniref:FadR/GntR family transcriptional regulator n=1 Tax=Occultella kanbiaonis TaxID=2675754 RepID=UPI0012B6F936|nr:FadR/GntR family transcriptional regulator [Occultella kanbiaonis]
MSPGPGSAPAPDPGGDAGDGRRGSRTDHVVTGIARLIIDGDLAAGDRLPVEKDLAARFDVSRGSLREAVRALAALGVVESRQGDGTYVTSLDPALLVGPLGLAVDLQAAGHGAHIHSVRRLLEVEAAGLAATQGLASTPERSDAVDAIEAAAAMLAEVPPGGLDRAAFLELDLAFHRAIGAASGNPVLAALIEALAGRTARHRLLRSATEAGVEHRTQAEHEAILSAVTAGDPERARVRMAAHLLAVEDFLRGSE